MRVERENFYHRVPERGVVVRQHHIFMSFREEEGLSGMELGRSRETFWIKLRNKIIIYFVDILEQKII